MGDGQAGEINVICQKGQARPSLLIFRNKQERDKLLELAPRLHKAKREYWR